jgi:hypothetical protein
MSQELGLTVLDPRYVGDRIPVMEHCWGLSRTAIQHFSGIDPLREPNRLNEAFRRVAETFEIDLLWGGGLPTERGHPGEESGMSNRPPDMFDWDDGGPRVRQGAEGLEMVQWGIFGAVHQEDGRHFVHVPKPASVDEALDFQPLQYFPKTVEEYEREFRAGYRAMLDSCGQSCYPVPHHYTTSFHWPLAIFGFELLCEAGLEEDRFHQLMERFAEVTNRVALAWSRVPGLRGFILHDDLTMTGGPIFPPDWYRRHVFPFYPSAFKPFNHAGIPVIFTSDGDCSVFVDDIFAAGADGLNFEYLVSLERLVSDYPDKLLVGNINSATVARGTAEQIVAETTRCLRIGAGARRFVVNIGGGLTHDMPVENLETYLQVRKRLCREARRS